MNMIFLQTTPVWSSDFAQTPLLLLSSERNSLDHTLRNLGTHQRYDRELGKLEKFFNLWSFQFLVAFEIRIGVIVGNNRFFVSMLIQNTCCWGGFLLESQWRIIRTLENGFVFGCSHWRFLRTWNLIVQLSRMKNAFYFLFAAPRKPRMSSPFFSEAYLKFSRIDNSRRFLQNDWFSSKYAFSWISCWMRKFPVNAFCAQGKVIFTVISPTAPRNFLCKDRRIFVYLHVVALEEVFFASK